MRGLDNSLRIWISGLSAVILLLSPGVTHGHHFKGLPHFNYFQNYPQVPQEEYLWQEGEYEFSLVIYDFQGIQRSDAEQPDNARLYLVIWSLRESNIYNGPISIQILDHGDPIHTQAFPMATEENIYSLHHILPKSGRYSLTVTSANGPVARIPFKLTSQKIPWGKWVTGALILLVAVVAAGSRRARVIRDRREMGRRKPKPRVSTKDVAHDH